MPIPNTKLFLSAVLAAGRAVKFVPNAAGDFQPLLAGVPVPPLLASTADMNGDGRDDIIFGAPTDSDKAAGAGRIFIELAPLVGGSTVGTGDSVSQIIIDGVAAGDHAGASVAGITDLNGDGRGEILIGAPGVENGALTDAGVAYVVFGKASTAGIDLADVFAGSGGYVIKGQAAGDAAGTLVQSIADLNGDGKADILIGAPGNDQGGTNAGAVYVSWGKGTSAAVTLANVAAGTGGFKIIGAHSNDAIGNVVGSTSDMTGDGKAEILIGDSEGGSGGTKTGLVYVVFGKSTGTAVNLANVEAGTGGFVITGATDEKIGSAVTGLGDVNGDGLGDLLVATASGDHAYVVYGKATGTAVSLVDVANGIGGFRINAESAGDFDRLSVTGGRDLNHDGVNDIVIGTPDNDEGGSNAGAVYIIWGGGNGTIDLSAIAQSMGGAKIVGIAGSLLGSTVSVAADFNGDGNIDVLASAPGTGEADYVIYGDASWQPDSNVYGTNGDDTIGVGYGGLHKVGDTADNIVALGGNDTIFAAGGDDVIDGGTGADSMSGGLGNDTYYVDNAGDTVTENAGEGTDSVISTIGYTLNANVENLVLSGSGLSGTGNALDNSITGTSGNDVIDGGAGADTMTGGLGNDSYFVDNVGDVVVEQLNGGTDKVTTSLDGYTLGANVENLVLGAGVITGHGNALKNSITGNALDNVIDGGAGADTMTGGGGNDTYYADNLGDAVVEALNGGTDTVYASVDGYALAANVENLFLTGAATHGTGNALDNHITGTSGNDVLDGGAGADTMAGGLGDDTYLVDNAGDVIVEAAGQGNDTVVASVDYALTDGASVENLTLSGTAHHGTGNSGANTITGGAGDDVLDGGAGIDTLVGGDGNDTYIVDTTTDTIVEGATGGIDTIVSSVDYTLAEGSNVENLTLSGAATHAVGNSGDNVLKGGAGNDTLEGGGGNDTLIGGAGADVMIGGSGDDTYYVDNPGDVVVEIAGGGTDTVVVSTDWTLADNIENVTLTGTGHTLTGNAANNVLKGDTGNDTLDGGAGDDTEEGGDGNDTLISTSGHDVLAGGAGDDVYKIHGGSAHIEDFQGHDTIDASEASGDSHIDLSGETESEIENEICDLGGGGTVTGALNVQFLQDLTGSFADDIANVRTLVPQIVAALNGVSGGAAFGVSSFRDKNYGAFGGAGDYVYETNLALGATPAALTAAYTNFVATGGADLPEAQLEALLQLGLRASGEVGYQTNAARFAVVFTDATFHTAADGTAAGILTPNNGNAIINDGGILENYPEIAQVRAALEAANIIPIFAIAGGFDADYQALAAALGRGTEVTLTSNSSNIVAAITSGITAATVTHIAAAIGGAGNDTLIGNVSANELTGGLGDDTLEGRGGNDLLHGGAGMDTAVYSGAITDYSIVDNGDGTTTVTDNRSTADNEGSDILDQIEFLSFAGTLYNIDGTSVLPPTVLTLASERLETTIGQASALDAAMLLDNDSNNNGLAMTVTGVANATGGTVALVDGKLVFTAAGKAGGFDYTVTASDGSIGTAHVSVTGVATNATGVNRVAGPQFIAADLVGLAGNDKLTGGAGNDRLDGGAGNDILNGAGGADVMIGGTGNDRYYVDNVGDQAIEASAVDPGTGKDLGGTDSVFASVSFTLGDNIESLIANGPGDLTLTGNGLANTITGGAGNDTLVGLGGNDMLDGGAGADVMIGGLGDDKYYVDNAADQVIEVSAIDPGTGQDVGGTDTVFASVSFTLGDNIERVIAKASGDLTLTGNDLANAITGWTGNDTLVGLAGKDTISGGAGDDVLIGGTGSDTLTGGAGADLFAMDSLTVSADRDIIKDFEVGVDHIQLDHAVFAAFSGHALGTLAAGDLSFGTKAMTAEQHLIYNSANGALFYDADGRGGAAQIQIAALGNHAALTAADILLS